MEDIADTEFDELCINMSEIEDIADTEFDKLLQQVHLSELDVVDSRINERLDMSEELLGVISDPADDMLSTLGCHGRCPELCSVHGCSHLWVWRLP